MIKADPTTKNNKQNRPKYYYPNQRGFEREIIKRLEYWQKLKQSLEKK